MKRLIDKLNGLERETVGWIMIILVAIISYLSITLTYGVRASTTLFGVVIVVLSFIRGIYLILP